MRLLTQLNDKMIYMSMCFILFFFGCIQHLNVLEFLKEPFSFGDEGDGLFNLWLLQKGYIKIFSDYMSEFSNGGIFWPKGGFSYFWSDNLLVYVPFFGIFYFVTQNPFISFSLLTILLFLAAFISSNIFLKSLYTIHRESNGIIKQEKWSLFLIPFFAYFIVFSEAKLRYLQHWQNLSYFWIILMTASFLYISCTNISFHRKSKYFQLIVLAQVCLLYSIPYFAVIGHILLITWLFIQIKIDKILLLDLMKSRYMSLFMGLTSFVFLLWFYIQAPKQTYSNWYIYENSMRWWHLFIPRSGWARTLLSIPFDLPEINHEVCAYLGAGLIFLCIVVAGYNIKAAKAMIANVMKQKSFWFILLLLVSIRIFRIIDIKIGGYLGLIFFTILSFWLFSRIIKKEFSQEKKGLSILVFFLILSYGIASGPGRMFMKNSFNVSIWGFVKIFFSPIENMRAIGRVAGLGQSFLLGTIFLLILAKLHEYSSKNHSSRNFLHGLLAVGLILQLLDPIGTQAHFHRTNLEYLQPNLEEKAWFKSKKTSMVVYPSNPFPLNTFPMLYFSEFPEISLLNGYSAHSTHEWDNMMKMGLNSSEPNLNQLEFAAELGAEYAVIFKWRTSMEHIEKLKMKLLKIEFENSKLAIIDIKRLNNKISSAKNLSPMDSK